MQSVSCRPLQTPPARPPANAPQTARTAIGVLRTARVKQGSYRHWAASLLFPGPPLFDHGFSWIQHPARAMLRKKGRLLPQPRSLSSLLLPREMG